MAKTTVTAGRALRDLVRGAAILDRGHFIEEQDLRWCPARWDEAETVQGRSCPGLHLSCWPDPALLANEDVRYPAAIAEWSALTVWSLYADYCFPFRCDESVGPGHG